MEQQQLNLSPQRQNIISPRNDNDSKLNSNATTTSSSTIAKIFNQSCDEKIVLKLIILFIFCFRKYIIIFFFKKNDVDICN